MQRTQGQSLRALRAGWVAAILLAQQALLDGLTSSSDGLSHTAVLARVKCAELALKTVAQTSLVVVPPEALATMEDEEHLTVDQRSRQLRALYVAQNYEDSERVAKPAWQPDACAP